MRHGCGTQRWQDGAVYEGQWSSNSANGKGRVAQGMGIYNHLTDQQRVTCYSGLWMDDLQHGYGVEVWEEGCRYEGDFRLGQKDGLGIYTWTDGSSYEGSWRGNTINGPG